MTMTQGQRVMTNAGRLSLKVVELRAQLARTEKVIAKIRSIVDAQANDEGLWFIAETASEAYIQQELRRLHAAIEAE